MGGGMKRKAKNRKDVEGERGRMGGGRKE